MGYAMTTEALAFSADRRVPVYLEDRDKVPTR
jgi:hypothetical protein